MTYQEEKQAIRDAIASFPALFGLRAWPGKVFRIGEQSSLDDNIIMLYTEVRDDDGTWVSFVKGTPDEFRANITVLMGMRGVV